MPCELWQFLLFCHTLNCDNLIHFVTVPTVTKHHNNIYQLTVTIHKMQNAVLWLYRAAKWQFCHSILSHFQLWQLSQFIYSFCHSSFVLFCHTSNCDNLIHFVTVHRVRAIRELQRFLSPLNRFVVCIVLIVISWL